MTNIVTGNFEQLPEAKQALSDLERAGFALDQMTTFFVRPAAEPDSDPRGAGLPPADGAARGAAAGVLVGAAVGVAVGMATLPIIGPAAIALAGAGAYAGSLAGAMGKLENKNEPDAETPLQELPPTMHRRKAGTLIAVAVPASEQQKRVADILQASGATDIELTEGNLVDGQWTDFDPLAAVQLLES